MERTWRFLGVKPPAAPPERLLRHRQAGRGTPELPPDLKETFVYGPEGDLLFSGGITPARGEIGSSAGRTRVLEVLRQNLPAQGPTAVFGCPLADSRTGSSR